MRPSPSARRPEVAPEPAAARVAAAGDAGAQRAFELAAGALARKERTRSEVEDLLAERGVERTDAVAAIQRLLAIGELDDERFAQRFAEDKRELAGWGPGRIREALRVRGVDAGTAERAAAAEHAGEQAQRAARLLRERGQPLGDDRGRSRALAYLARRGFDYEVAYEAVRRAGRQAA